MVVLIMGDVLRGVVCGNTMPDPLEFRQANPIEFEELITSRGLNIEEGTRPAPRKMVEN